MVDIARKNLFSEKARLLITVGGVALSIMLIIVLWGLYQGWSGKMSAYIDSVDADLWVSQDGAADMSHSVSIMPETLRPQLQAAPGVARVEPFVGRQVIFSLKGEDVRTFLIGYDPATDIGGPVRLVSGRNVAGSGEIVVDRVFARSNGVKIGDVLEVLGRPLRIVGISAEGNLVIAQYSFVTLADAQTILQSPGFVSFFLVRTTPGADIRTTQAAINDLPGIQAMPQDEFRVLTRRIVDSTFLPIIVVLVTIGAIVGIAVIALTIYTSTIEKSREYGVLKAIGASNWRLYSVILEQAVITAVAGYGAGVALALVANRFIEQAAPSFITLIRPIDLAGLLVLALAMAAASSYVPVRRLLSIDPALAFR